METQQAVKACPVCGTNNWRAGTAGLGFFLWLVWPRHKVTTGVDRWVQCQGCGTKSAA